METSSALSVSELNEYARRLLAGDPLLRSVQVTGEISGYKHHISGHRYFSLKDETARVQCVMFRQNAMGLTFKPEDGMRVTVNASASIFPRDGAYQLYVNAMRKSGQGDLYAQFEKLKRKLMAEGLFDPALKKEIPAFPRVIGVATSETGAAVRDIIRVARRRDPGIGILLSPCAVQGASAPEEIVRAIERLNANGESDVLLVGRGGGSIEDLWAFNDERVARAIAASRIPVISCVGHEVDFTIADFVADLRAATPSAAAELAVPERAQLEARLDERLRRLGQLLVAAQSLRRYRWEKAAAARVLSRPEEAILKPHQEAMDRLYERLFPAMNGRLERERHRLEKAEVSLRAMNPASVLERGYAIVRGENGLITDAGQIEEGMPIHIRLSHGGLNASVTEIIPEGAPHE